MDDDVDLFGEVHPIRKGHVGYLDRLINLTHAAVWGLAPVDRTLRPEPIADELVEHVWLIEDGQLVEAVLDLCTGAVLARRT